MDWNRIVLIMVGYQNDYFVEDGILWGVIEELDRIYGILDNIICVVNSLLDMLMMLIQMFIIFMDDYSELMNLVGIFKIIVDVKVFQVGSFGLDVILEFKEYGEWIVIVVGKRGLNVFFNM